MVSGTATPLRSTVGNVMVARNAGWYMRGEPLEVTVNRETLRYLPYSTATRIEPNQIVYIGNVNGYPVYADRDEVADVLTAINTARAGRTDAELGTILAGDTQIRNTVQGMEYLYVPLDAIGCTFQPLARQEDVRKGGK
jgi:Iap family predicted aminopeptidase